MCAARQRHVYAIVHHDSRPRAARDGENVFTETRQLAGFEVAFPNLQHVNARFDGMTHLRNQAFASTWPGRVSSKAVTVCDEMENQNVP